MDPFRAQSALSSTPLSRAVQVAEIRDELQNHGVAVFYGVHGMSGLLALARSLGDILPHPHNNAHGVTVVAEQQNSTEGALGAGFTRAALAPHTDRADKEVPPPLLVNLCTVQADTGGESTFVDGEAVYRFLNEQEPEALRALTDPRAVSYGRSHVYTGPVFHVLDGALLARVWPREAGRFSAEAEEAYGVLERVIAAHAKTVMLQAGQGYVINNHRWLHGRRAYTGKRVMLRMAVAPPRTGNLGAGAAGADPRGRGQV